MYVASNGANGFAGSYGGGKLGGGQPSARGPLPHVNDLTSVPAGVDRHLPIRKLLEVGDGCIRQADTWVMFNRPDLALQEYMRGYTIAIEIIPHHKEYSSLRQDRGGLGRLYEALQLKIRIADAKFDKIKEDIKADNERTGVQPVQKGATRPESPRSPPPPPPPPNHPPPPSPPRQKPAVQPKPQALHGNSIQANSLHRRADSADLNARFANLRAPSTQPQPPQQDPRIKTYPLVPPPPPAPRGSSRPLRNAVITADTSVPSLPKVPDAIYSPARGTVTSEDAQLPSSTPRGLFSRTGSSTSITGPRNGSVTSLAQQSTTNGIRSARGSVESKPPMLIPETPVITPEQLYDLMRSRSGDILLIDIRSREDFESGHILSQHTICIEPSVLLRENMSAGDIGESNVLAPIEEQRAFERRDKFELVVLYDEDSKMIPYVPSSDAQKALVSLNRALVDLNYDRELRNAPKLLEGGLDAWVDLMGPNSLRTLASGKTSAAALAVPSWSLGTSGPKQKAFGARRLSTYKVKPLRPDEVKQWEETIRKEDMDVEQSPNFVRSTEDFLRRFPPVLLEQESMTSSSASGSDGLSRVPSSINDQLAKYDELPVPPTRPAPAIPRPSYSGLSPQDDRATATAMMVQPQSPLQVPTGGGSHGQHFTGLHNSGVWCYANSMLQVLRVTPGFGRELVEWRRGSKWQMPSEPQLMMNIVANLFQWMDAGCFQVMRARTLMEYTEHLTKGGPIEFGNCRDQQDTAEYLDFLFTNMDTETNLLSAAPPATIPPSPPPTSNRPPTGQEKAIKFWNKHLLTKSDSIIDRYFRGLEQYTLRCSCRHEVVTMEPSIILTLPVTPGLNTLDQLLKRAYSTDPHPIPDYKCDSCKALTVSRRTLLARLPEILIFQLGRFEMNGTKVMQKIEFPMDINMEPYYLPKTERGFGAQKVNDFGWGQEFKYRCYGIIIHQGRLMTSGHYYSYVRTEKMTDGSWYHCNDQAVNQIKMTPRLLKDKIYADGSAVPYLLFYQRKRIIGGS